MSTHVAYTLRSSDLASIIAFRREQVLAVHHKVMKREAEHSSLREKNVSVARTCDLLGGTGNNTYIPVSSDCAPLTNAGWNVGSQHGHGCLPLLSRTHHAI